MKNIDEIPRGSPHWGRENKWLLQTNTKLYMGCSLYRTCTCVIIIPVKNCLRSQAVMYARCDLPVVVMSRKQCTCYYWSL